MAKRILEVDLEVGEFTLRFDSNRLRLLPGATMDRLRTANREVLLAVRGFLDRVIEYTEPKGRPAGRRRTRVEVKEEKTG